MIRSLCKNVAKRLVVAIDDDAEQLRAYQVMLADAYDVHCFSTLSPECFSLAAQAQHVILDLSMEPHDGIEFIAQGIGDGKILKSLVICSGMDEAVTSLCSDLAIRRGVKSVRCVGKPVTRRALIKALEETSSPTGKVIPEETVDSLDLLDDALRTAMDEQVIVPFWQPQISVASGRVSGVEVLARWPRTDFPEILPAHFIQRLESYNLAATFFRYMLRKSLAGLARWQDAVPYGGSISVNLPPRTLDEPELSDEIVEQLMEHGIAPSRLILEITESEAHEQHCHFNSNVARLLMAGVQFAIDDFGMGYSNVARLSSGIFSELKLDGQMVRDYLQLSSVRNIVNSLVKGARQSQLRVVAEGVSDNATLDCMVRLGCTDLQGYLFAPPMNECNLVTWLQNHQNVPFNTVSLR